ncbi:TetR family transcriptional regulator [Amycolatopsis sp. NPDC051758]|uniref:TetR family transcriptional regulator n=1 Tax=Amycolatopsis sp. NPDC051758 TaxID=3363935 RepID=UPI0037B42316
MAKLVTSPGRQSEARERLLSTASRLFYAEGIRAVGVDRVIAEAESPAVPSAGISKARTISCGPTWKRRISRSATCWRPPAGRSPTPPPFSRPWRGESEDLCSAGFRGCAFINAAAEYPERDSVVRQAALTHRAWFHQKLQDAFEQAGAADPPHSADAMVAMRDGAMVAGYLGDPRKASETLAHGVAALLTAR